MIRALTNPSFLSAYLGAIRSARRSIILVNYLAQMGEAGARRDPVRRIASELALACRRKVRVSVFLEGSKFENNYPFYRYVKDRGADAWMDTSRTFIHQKVLVVDERLLIAGSHNLTAGSLMESQELSILTDDRAAIGTFLKEGLQAISRQREAIAGASEKGAGAVALPAPFLRRVAAPLFRAHAEGAFDLYLTLCREDGGRPRPLRIDPRRWCRELGFAVEEARPGIGEKYRRYYHAQRINRILGQMRRAQLVEVDRKRDALARTRLAEGGEEARIEVPEAFWSRGWMRRLSFAAKYFYVIALAETEGSPFFPWWSLSMRRLVAKHRCDHGIGKGAVELERAGILEILRGTPKRVGRRYAEEAQYYRLNPLGPEGVKS